MRVDLLELLRDGVRVENFFTPFRGDFKGQFYHAQTPPSIQIENAAICAQYHCLVGGIRGFVRLGRGWSHVSASFGPFYNH